MLKHLFVQTLNIILHNYCIYLVYIIDKTYGAIVIVNFEGKVSSFKGLKGYFESAGLELHERCVFRQCIRAYHVRFLIERRRNGWTREGVLKK